MNASDQTSTLPVGMPHFTEAETDFLIWYLGNLPPDVQEPSQQYLEEVSSKLPATDGTFAERLKRLFALARQVKESEENIDG